MRDLLPLLHPLLHDNSEKVRLAFLELLILVKGMKSLKFWRICSIDDLLGKSSSGALRTDIMPLGCCQESHSFNKKKRKVKENIIGVSVRYGKVFQMAMASIRSLISRIDECKAVIYSQSYIHMYLCWPYDLWPSCMYIKTLT